MKINTTKTKVDKNFLMMYKSNIFKISKTKMFNRISKPCGFEKPKFTVF